MQWLQVLVQSLPLKMVPVDGDMGGKVQEGQILEPGLALSFL